MPTVAEIRVKLLADLAELDKMRSQTRSAFQQVNTDARRNMREAQGSIALLGEEIGVHLPRHVRSFLVTLPGIAPLMAAAFSTTAVIALGMAVFEAGKKIAEFAEQQREAAEKLRQSQEAFGLTVQTTYNSFEERLLTAGIRTDELRHDHVDALHKELQLIDMQGFDHLAAAFEKLEQAADKTFDNLKSNWTSVITQLSSSQASGFKGSLERFGEEYSSLLAQGKGTEAQALLNSTQEREEQNRVDLTAIRATGIRSWAHAGGVDSGTNALMERLRSRGITDYSDQTYNASTLATSSLEAQQNIVAVQRQTTSADRQNTTLTAGKGESSGLIRNLEEQLNQQVIAHTGTTSPVTTSDKLGFWQSHLDDFGTATEQYKAVIAKIAELTNTLTTAAHETLSHLRATIKQRSEEDAKFPDTFGMLGNRSLLATSPGEDIQHSKDVAGLGVEQAKTNAALQEAITRYGQATGAISAHGAALQELQAKQSKISAEYLTLGAEITDLKTQAKDSLLDPDRLQAIGDKIASLKGQQQALQDQSYSAQLTYQEQTMSAMDQVFAHMSKGAQDLDNKIASIMEHTLDGLNDQFVGAIFGDKTNFAKVFEQASRSLTKTGLEYVEGSFGKHGSSGKIGDLNLSATNGALNVHIASAAPGGSGSTSNDPNSGSSFLNKIPGLSSITNSSFVRSLRQQAGKFAPGAMDAASGLMEMFAGPHHSKGEGSGVANAEANAMHRANTLSRFLGGAGAITKGAGSMTFAGMGGASAMDSALQNSNVSSGMSSMLSDAIPGLVGFASGGDPVGGVPIEIGETGPEVWSPPESGGHITPNRDVSFGGGDNYSIDARGTDPALTQINVARAISMSQQRAVGTAQSRMLDHQRRVPR